MRVMCGVDIRSRTVRETEFVCPRCGIDRTGHQIEPQRWFSIAGVPVIPLATLAPEIVCDSCDHHCDIGVLDVPTTAELSRYLTQAVRGSVALVVDAGHRSPGPLPASAVAVAVAVMTAEGHDYDEARLGDDIDELDGAVVMASLVKLAAELTPHGKQGFLHRMASIALADGSIAPAQHRALIEMGVALGMSAPHINGVLAVAAIDLEAA